MSHTRSKCAGTAEAHAAHTRPTGLPVALVALAAVVLLGGCAAQSNSVPGPGAGAGGTGEPYEERYGDYRDLRPHDWHIGGGGQRSGANGPGGPGGSKGSGAPGGGTGGR